MTQHGGSYLVSILIPVYNTQRYVAEAIESALNQSYKNIEIIIVDDGSTDNSWKIIESYKLKYSNIIKTFKQGNKGACSARNKAFELSSGKYIQYLDADDLLSPEKINASIKLLKQEGNEECVVLCKWLRFYYSITDVKKNSLPIFRSYDNPTSLLLEMLKGGGFITPNAWLAPRKIIDLADSWDEDLDINQDGEFFSRVIMNSSRIIYSENGIAYYRSGNKNSLSNANSGLRSKAEGYLKSYMKYERNLLEKIDTEISRNALAYCYSAFISNNILKFPDLASEAENRLKGLGENFVHHNKMFYFLDKLIGLRNTLIIKHYLRNYLSGR
jgi:glycosyltransferase involved in cell wall biosynthesis